MADKKIIRMFFAVECEPFMATEVARSFAVLMGICESFGCNVAHSVESVKKMDKKEPSANQVEGS